MKSSPTYSGSGTEPLRSNEKKYTSAPATGSSADGKPAGGTENRGAKTITLSAAAAKMAKGTSRIPKAVRSFRDGVSK